MKKQIKERSILSMAILTLVTLGLYGIYWTVKTKNEIKSLGADIPSAWLMILPFGSLYFTYKYADGFVNYVKKGNHILSYFFILLLPYILSFIMTMTSVYGKIHLPTFFMFYLPASLQIEFIPMMIVQLELNKLAK